MISGARRGRGRIGRLLLGLGLAFLGLAALAAVARVNRAPQEAASSGARAVENQLIAPGAHVRGDVTAPAGAVTVGAGAVVDGNVTAFGGTVRLAAGTVITGDITTQGGVVSVAGHVHGNVTTVSGDIILNPTAQVDHNILSTSGNIYKAPGAQVDGSLTTLSGKVYATLPPARPVAQENGSGFFDLVLRLFAALALTGLALIAGSVTLVIAPRPVARVEATLEHAFLASAIIGLLTALLLPIVTVVVFFVLSFTLIGPFIAGFLELAAGFLGLVGLGLWIGERLAQSSAGARLPHSPLARGLLGLLLILAAADLLGIVWSGLGFLLIYLLGCLGLGAVVLSRFGTIVPIHEHTLPFGLRRATHPLAGSPPDPSSERKAS